MTRADNIAEECPKCHHHNHKFYVKVIGRTKLGHCKHCDYRINTTAKPSPIAPAAQATGPEQIEYTLPYDFTVEWKDWPSEAIQWVHQYGITQQECRAHMIGYSNGRVWLTIFDNGLASMQGRLLSGDGPKGAGNAPKYITRANRLAAFSCGAGDTLFITEDMLSAIKAGRHATGMALCGTSMHDVHLRKILELQPKRVLICLDNDNSIVRKQQRKCKKTLDKFVDDVLIIRMSKDLKAQTNEYIVNLVSERAGPDPVAPPT